ncbi:uncharacterized protein LOC128550306 [Mercenaria mercenaria]|uniref:uncharacterized protein LOC128550306 n=1 Tax=Mercenaria mercenaria TaxID=6596 RepID=UPI00234F7CF3|nr:uncharacterized protein LOC128550306 [Mercenaria mercenaria]
MPRKKKSRLRVVRKYTWKKNQDKPKDCQNINGSSCSDESDQFFSNMFSNSTCTPDSSMPHPKHDENFEIVDSDGYHADEFYVILDKPYRYCAEDDLEEFVSSHKCRMYSAFREECKSSIIDLQDFVPVKSSKEIKFVRLYDSDSAYSSPRVQMCLCVDSDFCISISVHGRSLPDTHTIWKDIGRTCNTLASVQKALCELNKYSVCEGNQDKDLQELIPVGAFLDVSEGYRYQGYREAYYVGSTIRSTSCCMLINQISKRCQHCKVYRRTLKKTLYRRQSSERLATPEKDWTRSRVSNFNLTNSQKVQKLKQMRTYTDQLEIEVARLTGKVNGLIQKEGVVLSNTESEDLINIMEMSDKDIKESYPDENSYQRIFWSQQQKYSKLKNKRGMKWHPMIIKWCIFLKSKSSTTYDALRQSGFIQLPSERTLFDYTSLVKKGTGFQPDIVNILMDETSKFDGHQRIVGMLQDEVRIKSDLVYNRHSGELVGFVDLGNVSNDLTTLNENNSTVKPLARYVLVLMIRGVSSNLKFPLAHFATNGVTSDQLFCILWEAVEILELDVGLEVMFITSDGASPNRRFIRLHNVGGNETVFKARNIFAPEPRYIYFISDPPHLLKTARNCFSNSYSHNKTRRMWMDGYDMSWLHIVDLYNEHCSGIYRLCPKLTKQHIDITAFGAMKVRLAAQVLSSTVANALELNYNNRVTETVKFIRHMDKFFDCLNVRNLGEGRKKRNDNILPFTSVDDPRLEYLQTEFLGYFQSWKLSVMNRPGQFTKSERNGMLLSYQTMEGLEITVNSVVSCIKDCLRKGMEFVLTEKFNQDPIEQHFGIHRSSQGCNTNPNLNEFNNAMVKIRTVGGQAIAPFTGNTKRHLNFPAVDTASLPKRNRVNRY